MAESRWRGSTLARIILLLALFPLAVGIAACDSGTEPDPDLPDIVGTWTAPDGDFTLFLAITSTTLTEYYGVEGQCFFVGVYTIVSRDGDTVTLRPQGTSQTFNLIFRREGSSLRLIDPSSFNQQGILMSSTSTDVTALPECGQGAGGSDPAIDCASLTPITVGGTINGELTNTDESWIGSYYDLYSLTLDAQQQVTITQSSGQIDSYLYLYESDGTYITEDDDSGGNFDSAITQTLSAGCYRIEASSWGSGETGTYTLSVN